ncbi:MAG: tetratricopeptide repeat protein, partial [Bacteroidales bacterium]|nr:tetratricopeptide repeat protein [Bacteroidales bacterium]
MKKISLFIALLVGLTAIGYAQRPSAKAQRFYDSGLMDYDAGKIPSAIAFFKSAVAEDPNFNEAWLLLGETYEQSNKPDSAIWAYRKFADLNPSIHPRAIHNLAALEYSQGFYKEAEQHFLEYLKYPIRNEDTKIKANNSLQKVLNATKLMKNPVPFSPISLGDSINTISDEYFPTLTVDQKTLIFTKRHKEIWGEKSSILKIAEDFFISSYNDSTKTWNKATLMPEPVNSPYNEGA